MLAYFITGTTSHLCADITTDQVSNYPAPQWYCSETPITWATHRIVNGIIVEIPIVPPEPPYIPTTDEAKAQALQSLDYEYQRQSKQLSDSWLTATISGNTDVALEIAEEKSLLTQEYTVKRGNIK